MLLNRLEEYHSCTTLGFAKKNFPKFGRPSKLLESWLAGLLN